MKQTAVEWLFENYLDNPLSNEDVTYNIEVLEQAKKMEKEQIIHAVEWNYKSNMGEVYYNATYKKRRNNGN